MGPVVAGLSSSQKKQYLKKWYAEAQAAGTPFCQYLQEKNAAILENAESGGTRLISSTSNAGQSVSYAPGGEQPISTGEVQQLLADAAEACPLCEVPDPSTDQDYLDCLLGSNICAAFRAYTKLYLGLRV